MQIGQPRSEVQDVERSGFDGVAGGINAAFSDERKCTVTCFGCRLFSAEVSAAQIITELPKLAPPDLLVIRRKLIELAEQNEDVAICDAAALEGVQMLDRMEQEDAGR